MGATWSVPIEIPDATMQELIFVNPNNTSCTFPFRYLQGGINDLKFEFEEYDFSTIPGGSNFIANYEKLRNFVQSAVDSNMSFTTKENFANYTATLVAFKRSFRDLKKYVDVKEAINGVINAIFTMEVYTAEYRRCAKFG
ncbi:hypothetical protein BGX24_000376 [Mortierella sp. AD032]|nr:hypothetical protein BGX24_000376 [Mortierella sp. AD032]